MITLIITLFTITSIFRSFSEIHGNRLTWSYEWIQKMLLIRSRIYADPYHLFDNNWIPATIAGVVLALTVKIDTILFAVLLGAGIWLYVGTVFDVFYHIIWMKSEYRDPENMFIFRLINLF